MKKRFFFELTILAVLILSFTSCDWFPWGSKIIGGMEFLGRGYDVFSSYADPLEVKSMVLDYGRMDKADLLEQVQLEKSEFQTIEGETVQEYMEDLSVKAGVGGSYAGFSGSVEVNFDESHYSYSDYSFATVEALIYKHTAKIKLDATTATLKNYLTDNAREAINDASVAPEQVFVTYGTHVLRGIIIGGRLDYNVSADMTKVTEEQSIGVFAEASYEGAFSVSVSSETVSSTDMSSFNSVMKKSLKIYGGSSEYGQYIIGGDESGYTPWIESIADNLVFCDFDRTTPLIPIWDFCDDPARKAALEAGYADYAAARALGTSAFPRQCIVDIKIHKGALNSSANTSPDVNGYYTIVQDLNEGAGGEYIYIQYKYGLDDSASPAPITGVHIRNRDYGDPELPGYIKPAGFCDLNEDAGGDYIYLYFSRGGPQPVRSLCTINTSDSDNLYTSPTGTSSASGGRTYAVNWYRDLNEDAGGDYIYFGLSYDHVD